MGGEFVRLNRREFVTGLGLVVLAGATGAAVGDCEGDWGEVELFPIEGGETVDLIHSVNTHDEMGQFLHLEALGTVDAQITDVIVTDGRGFKIHSKVSPWKRYVNIGTKEGKPVILEAPTPEGPWELAEVVDSTRTPNLPGDPR